MGARKVTSRFLVVMVTQSKQNELFLLPSQGVYGCRMKSDGMMPLIKLSSFTSTLFSSVITLQDKVGWPSGEEKKVRLVKVESSTERRAECAPVREERSMNQGGRGEERTMRSTGVS